MEKIVSVWRHTCNPPLVDPIDKAEWYKTTKILCLNIQIRNCNVLFYIKWNGHKWCKKMSVRHTRNWRMAPVYMKFKLFWYSILIYWTNTVPFLTWTVCPGLHHSCSSPIGFVGLEAFLVGCLDLFFCLSRSGSEIKWNGSTSTVQNRWPITE